MSGQVERAIKIYETTAADYAGKVLAISPHRERLKIFQEKLPAGGLIGDLGCGPGRESQLLTNAGFKVVGIDLTFAFLKIAQQNNAAAFLANSDIRNLPLKTGIFDGICSFAMVQHLEQSDFIVAFSEVARILKPGGYFQLTTKEGEGLLTTEPDYFIPYPREYTLIRAEALHAMLSSVGFERVELYVNNDKRRPEINWVNCLYQKR